MMYSLVEFMNRTSIMNLIINACVIHYYFVYIHPFFDGNGRTARAVMNIYLLKNGYGFFKYFSISKILAGKRKSYYSAIKECEDYGSDITYFVDFYSKLINETVSEIRKNYVIQYNKTIIENLLEEKEIFLNDRQNKTVKSSLKSMNKHFDLKQYQKKHKITYETARKDMELLVEIGIYKKIKNGKKFIYKMEKLVDVVEGLNRF
jgi:Fic family protein